MYGIPGNEPIVAVLLIVAVGWVLVSRITADVDPDRAGLAGGVLGWWRRQATPVRSRFSIGPALFLVGVMTLALLRLAGADPFSGQVMLGVLALAFSAVQLVSGAIAAD